MRIVVIGLGSMGKRRLRLLNRIDASIELLGIDGRVDRQEEALKQAEEMNFSLKTFSAISDIPESLEIDAAVISTSPLSHNAIIKECLTRNWSVFTELNLVADGYDENMALADKMGKCLYMSSTPMFRREMKYITDKVKNNQGVINYVYHVGQYLPDWHPWESYKDFFIGNKKTNGCREILAVELPWLSKCFGDITDIQSQSMRQTKLDIDFCDCYNLLVTHADGHKGVIIADVVCRKPVRFLEVSGEDLFITWRGSFDSLMEYDLDEKKEKNIELYSQIQHRDGYNSLIIENAYEEELVDFLAVLAGEKEAEYSFEKDRVILDWIDKVENNS